MCAQAQATSFRNKLLLLQNSTKALSARWGQALLGRPFLTSLSTSVATSFA